MRLTRCGSRCEEMERIQYKISGGLSPEAIERIAADAFALLESVGVRIDNDDVLAELSRRQGVSVREGRAFYGPELVERFIEWVQKDNAEYMLNIPGRDAPLVRGPFLCTRVWEQQAGRARMAKVEDLARASRLMDSFDAEGVPAVHPQDVDSRLRQVVTAKVAYENSRAMGGFMLAGSVDEAEILCRMGQAAGRCGVHVCLQIPHSPLRLDGPSLGIILDMARARRTPAGVAVGGGAMPLAGAAAPLLPPGFLAQGLAEALAAYGTGKLLNEKVRGYCSVFPGTFDMRSSGMAMASPEAVLLWLAVRQLHEHFFGQAVGGDFACMGKVYDAQAAAEKTAAVVTAVLSGATTFVNLGMTPMDEVFHFEGAIIDMEILDYAWRLRRGIGWEETPTVDIVREAERDGTFLMHTTTMRFREELWSPSLFTREGLSSWMAAGSPALLERAAAAASDRIEANDYHPEPDVARELERLLEEADKRLV